MYLMYSVVHRSIRFATGMPFNGTGHAVISMPGISWRIRYLARLKWSTVVTKTIRSRPWASAIRLIATAFWYVDFESDSTITFWRVLYWPTAPAPMIYNCARGYRRSCRSANGIRRASPVRTKMLSFGNSVAHRVGAVDLKIMPPITKHDSTNKDGFNNFIGCLLKSQVWFSV